MKKVLLSVVVSSSLLFTSITANAKEMISDRQVSPFTETIEVNIDNTQTVEQVSSAKATAKKGNFKLKYNTNVRTDAGTKHKIVITAKKGATATATHQKKVGKETWYKVKVSGKTGWVLSSLVTEVKAPAKKPAAKKAPAKKPAPKKATAPKETAKKGNFKLKYNTNVRADAGTKHKIVITAKKGATATATHQKKVGKETWYKVKVSGKTGWVLSSLVTEVKATAKKPAPKKPAAKKPAVTKASNSSATKLIANAKALRGIKYKFGGTTTSGFDCSGYVQYVFNKSGKKIARDTGGQFNATKKVTNPKAGDLVFFQNTYKRGISHVGIYLGNGDFIHAGSSGVVIQKVQGAYWKNHFHSYRR